MAQHLDHHAPDTPARAVNEHAVSGLGPALDHHAVSGKRGEQGRRVGKRHVPRLGHGIPPRNGHVLTERAGARGEAVRRREHGAHAVAHLEARGRVRPDRRLPVRVLLLPNGLGGVGLVRVPHVDDGAAQIHLGDVEGRLAETLGQKRHLEDGAGVERRIRHADEDPLLGLRDVGRERVRREGRGRAVHELHDVWG